MTGERTEFGVEGQASFGASIHSICQPRSSKYTSMLTIVSTQLSNTLARPRREVAGSGRFSTKRQSPRRTPKTPTSPPVLAAPTTHRLQQGPPSRSATRSSSSAGISSPRTATTKTSAATGSPDAPTPTSGATSSSDNSTTSATESRSPRSPDTPLGFSLQMPDLNSRRWRSRSPSRRTRGPTIRAELDTGCAVGQPWSCPCENDTLKRPPVCAEFVQRPRRERAPENARWQFAERHRTADTSAGDATANECPRTFAAGSSNPPPKRRSGAFSPNDTSARKRASGTAPRGGCRGHQRSAVPPARGRESRCPKPRALERAVGGLRGHRISAGPGAARCSSCASGIHVGAAGERVRPRPRRCTNDVPRQR
jgi:hypothetical protein